MPRWDNNRFMKWSVDQYNYCVLSACFFSQWQKQTAIVMAGWPHRPLNINELRVMILCCDRSSSMEPAATRHQESAVAGVFQSQIKLNLTVTSMTSHICISQCIDNSCPFNGFWFSMSWHVKNCQFNIIIIIIIIIITDVSRHHCQLQLNAK